MKQYLTPNSIANDIRMRRSLFKGTFVIVEGDTDQRFFNRFVGENLCQVVSAYNKENAIDILEILNNDRFDGVLAIVDADFWRIDGIECSRANLFLTDTHDLETMILHSPALEKLMSEFGSVDKIDDLIKKRGKNVRQVLLDAGIPIGYLRWISNKENFYLKFENLDFRKFIDEKTLVINITNLIATVQNISDRRDLSREDIKNSIDQKLIDNNCDPWEVCCGHDLTSILSFGLRRAFGSHYTKVVSSDLIEKSLRLAYEEGYFLLTNLYKSLKAWEESNQKFRIFKSLAH
jgi:hypothetical protein